MLSALDGDQTYPHLDIAPNNKYGRPDIAPKGLGAMSGRPDCAPKRDLAGRTITRRSSYFNMTLVINQKNYMARPQSHNFRRLCGNGTNCQLWLLIYQICYDSFEIGNKHIPVDFFNYNVVAK